MARNWGINFEGGIGRAIGGLLTPMRVADVVLRPHPDFPGIKTFRCAPMCADITPNTCATNYSANRYAACTGCQIGALAVQDSLKPTRAPLGSGRRDSVPVAPHCIRCGKTSAGDTRSIGRVRFVNKGTECVSCFNRKSEVAKGSNSKHATPKLWAALRQATITYETGGKVRTEDVGLRSSRHECERWLAHVHPTATLTECAIDGVVAPPFAGEHPLYHGRELSDVCPPRPESFYTFASKPKKPKAAPRKRAKPLPAVSDRAIARAAAFAASQAAIPRAACLARNTSDATDKIGTIAHAAEETLADYGFGEEDWSVPLHKIAKTVTAESDHSDADGNGCARRNGWLPPLSEAEDLAYRRAFDTNEPAEPMGSVAVPDALPEPAEAVSEPVSAPEPQAKLDKAAETIQKLEAVDAIRPLTRKERREYGRLETKLAKRAARRDPAQPSGIVAACRAVIAAAHDARVSHITE
ncbi:hypothetical protein [Paraburkholderia tropica]|uniref:hypothetical protein n=1 Tax=Paraburkholderia tropica TaxID=92647 RepID=UPI002AB014FB|nr:hypothetical protein [Paraburkholderia tropica]